MSDLSQQLQEQVLNARLEQQPLKIVGGGSKAFMGRASTGSILNMAGHSGIVDYQPVELVLTARAGTSLIEIEAVLAEHNQVLAFEPPCFSNAATLGGTLACNQSGPGRPWTGSIRDHVLGTRVINGLGEHLRFGGQVMKNVAGYDVSRLQAGAMGTLGIITEISLKVLPKPAASRTLVWEMEAKEAIHFMNNLASRPKPLSAACWLAGYVYVRLSGAHSAVDATVSAFQKEWQVTELEEPENFWQQLNFQQLAFFSTGAPLWRFSVNSAANIDELDAHCLIDWGGAQRWYAASADKQQMQVSAAQAGGQVSLFSGGNRQLEVMHEPPLALKIIQQRVKKAFDPDAILNPGRLYSWM